MQPTLSATSTPAVKSRHSMRAAALLLRIGIHVFGWLPLAELGFNWLTQQLTANPIQFIEQNLGHGALNLLVLALAVTPLVTLTGWRQLAKHRRALGLYAFFYFLLHFLTFAGLDYGLDLREILRLTTEKPFIVVGLLAGVILLALAATSFRFWMKRLGKNWHRLHKTVYLAGGLAVLHYAWAVKGSLTNLSGDILRPLSMGLLVLFLLIVRIPPVQRWIVAVRQRIANR